MCLQCVISRVFGVKMKEQMSSVSTNANLASVEVYVVLSFLNMCIIFLSTFCDWCKLLTCNDILLHYMNGTFVRYKISVIPM